MATLAFFPQGFVAHAGDHALVDVTIERASAYGSRCTGLTQAGGNDIRRLFVVYNAAPDELRHVVVVAQLQVWPAGGGVEVMDVLSTVATVHELLA